MKKLAMCHIIVALLYFTWLVSPFSLAWEWLDLKTYTLLSPLLSYSPSFWAICNSKAIDWIHDVVMFSFFLIYILKGPKLRRLLNTLVAIIVIAFTITVVNRHIFTGIRRKSPTKVFKATAPRLSKQVTWIDVKDKSKTSFPGDHATTALLFTGIVFILMGPRAGILASYYAVFFIAPRLVVGAHWLTDVAVGSASIAIIMLAWFYATPLASNIVSVIEAKTWRKNSMN